MGIPRITDFERAARFAGEIERLRARVAELEARERRLREALATLLEVDGKRSMETSWARADARSKARDALRGEGRCNLGCVKECKARIDGCASECPALPWQPTAALRKPASGEEE